MNKDLIWPLVHCSTLNIGKNRCECCWNMNPDHEPICWKTSDTADNKYKHTLIHTLHQFEDVTLLVKLLLTFALGETVTPGGMLVLNHNENESVKFLCIICMFLAGIQDTRWMAISWTAACPVKTLTSWAALKMATFTAGTWWKWVCLYIYVLVLP